MTEPIHFVAHCSVCGQGLVRIKTVFDQACYRSICQCDECDAAWENPTLKIRIGRNELEHLLSNCETYHWSTIEEVCLFGWAGYLRPAFNSNRQN